MINKAFFFIILVCCIMMGCLKPIKREPVPIIFDTDIGSDYDDVGAITILHKMAADGEAKILATVASNKYEGIAAILDIFNTYWDEPDIPIGVPKRGAVDKSDSQHWTDSLLANYSHKIKSNDEVSGSVEVYRKVLSDQPDTSVTVVSVGFLTNLANLLKSEPDEYSSLSGAELVKEKVKKMVCMAGKFPTGREFNVYNDTKAAKYTFKNWLTPIIFSSFEIGAHIKTGLPLIHNESIKNDPAKDAYSIAIPKRPVDSAGRMSWDLTAVLVAVRGYQPYFSLQEGRIKINSDGSNSWDDNEKRQYYLIQKSPVKQVENVINNLMTQQPKTRNQ